MKPITRYRGPLSLEQVAEGMNAAGRNAKRLCEDAQLLYDSGRYATALALAVLSIEESGKLSLLRGVACATTEERLKEAWKEYRDHRAKNVAWIMGELVAQGAKTLKGLAPIYDKDSDHPALLDVAKQLGLYTDCYGAGHWSEPTAAIDQEFAAHIVRIASVLVPKHETTIREVELWVEHVGKHWGTPQMLGGSVEFERAMQREGLKQYEIGEIEKFFGLTPDKPH